MNLRKMGRELNIPTWITESGNIDMSKYPIEHVTKDSLMEDEEKFRNACRLLGSMVFENRKDAGIYLMGLIIYYKRNIKRLEIIVENLRYFRNSECANFLLEELKKNTESNNSTRIYSIPL